MGQAKLSIVLSVVLMLGILISGCGKVGPAAAEASKAAGLGVASGVGVGVGHDIYQESKNRYKQSSH